MEDRNVIKPIIKEMKDEKEVKVIHLKEMASISWFSCLHIRPTASADNKGSSPITVEHHKTRPQNLL